MGSSIKTVADIGHDGMIVDTECHITNGLPSLIIVGFANRTVDEARERVRSAFYHSDIPYPKRRITINLAPADLPKDGTSYDLAIALAIMQFGGIVEKQRSLENSIVVGELSLDGSVRPVRGIIGKLLTAKSHEITTALIPFANLDQAKLVPGLDLLPISSLKDLYLGLSGALKIPRIASGQRLTISLESQKDNDFNYISGQARAKRALEIAAAGSHNIMINGPPGTGKSMLAKALPSILPPMTIDEILEVTHLHSLASKRYDKIISQRPFRSPHHSSSHVAIVGGGSHPKPGEVSLSHRGILFLDELPEFNRQTIEALRQPLEDKYITISRAKESLVYPADFTLVATSNPCPCGYYGTAKTCVCTAQQIHRYQTKISGPIIDRIDLYINVDDIDHEKLLHTEQETSSAVIKNQVIDARNRQSQRYSGQNYQTNSLLTAKDIKTLGGLDQSAEKLLNQAAKSLNLSARAYMRVIRVGRTIADLGKSAGIKDIHIAEALQYRRSSLNL